MMAQQVKSVIALYSCTFSRDLKRTVRMVESVMKHNKDNIPLYVSVPEEDLSLFSQHLINHAVTLFNEKDILRANPKLDITSLYQVSGGLRQQVIKSEFWRLGLAENYLVLDADCVFIHDFYQDDFIFEGNIPYSIIHEGREALQVIERFGSKKNRQHFLNDREPIKNALGRPGIIYDYGYAPFLWSAKVWASLDEYYLSPKGMNFLDAILFCGSEFSWYGEALLQFKAIPLYPREQFFRHYHYEYQLWIDKALGYTEQALAKDYLGVVYQSNWQAYENYGKSKKSFLSRGLLTTKRWLKKTRFKVLVLLRLIYP